MTITACNLSLNDWAAPESLTITTDEIGPSVDARGADWKDISPGTLDLSNSKLCRVDLRGADLSFVQLEGADLRLARYDNRTKWPSHFDYRRCGAIGPKAILNGCFLNGADLSEMDLGGASMMGTHLSGSDLSATCLENVRFAGADLRHAVLRGAQCCGARFSGCQLDYTDFRWANLAGADFSSLESVKGADFKGATDLNRLRADLLSRSYQELDTWNPLTRRTTRVSLTG